MSLSRYPPEPDGNTDISVQKKRMSTIRNAGRKSGGAVHTIEQLCSLPGEDEFLRREPHSYATRPEQKKTPDGAARQRQPGAGTAWRSPGGVGNGAETAIGQADWKTRADGSMLIPALPLHRS